MDAERKQPLQRIWLRFVIAGIILATLVWLAWPDKEPHYNGYPLSHWVTNYNTWYSDHEFAKQYNRAPLDVKAVPFLVDRLLSGPSLYERVYPRVAKYKWLNLKPPRNTAQTRAQAARVLRQMGGDAKNAVPALTRALKDPSPHVQVEAAMALGNIGPDSAPALFPLIEAFQQKDIFVRVQSMFALSRIAPEKQEVRELLLQALTNSESVIRYRATNLCERLNLPMSPAQPRKT